MNVLFMGSPFGCERDPLPLYRGVHDVRRLGLEQDTCYVPHFYCDPARETFPDVLARLSKNWRPDLIVCWFPEMPPPGH